MADKNVETSEQFSSRVSTMLADTLTMMSLSVGQDVGLVGKMLSYTEPKTCGEIAEDAGLKERYVYEWLGVMATGQFVDITADGRFIIPAHRHHALSNEGQAMASLATVIPRLASVQEQLTGAMRIEGPSGVPYGSYKGYHDWGFRSLQSRIDTFITSLDRVPGISQSMQNGITVCDMGCSNGYTTTALAEKFPKSEIHGMDISEEAIATAKNSVTEKGLSNCHFHVADAADLPADWTEKWDFITMRDVLHDIPLASKALLEMYRTLKKDGYISIMDLNVHSDIKDNLGDPSAAAWYGFSFFQCLPTSLYFPGSEGLGAAWGREKAMDMVRQAGFTDVNISALGTEMVIVGKKT